MVVRSIVRGVVRDVTRDVIVADNAVLRSITPATLAAGLSATFTVTGTFPDSYNVDDVTFSRPGITVVSVTKINYETLLLELSASDDIADGYIDLTVGDGTLSNALLLLSVYFLRDEFTTPESAPLASPRTCEPGPGTLTLVQTDGNFQVDANGRLSFVAQASMVWGDQGFYGPAVAREAGLTLLLTQTKTVSGNGTMFGFNVAAGTGLVTGTGTPSPYIWSLASTYVYTTANNTVIAASVSGMPCGIVLRTSGALYLAKVSGVWTLLFVTTDGTQTPLYPVWTNSTATGTLDYFRIPKRKIRLYPLISDSFNRSEIGSTDGAGVEESGGGGLTWTVTPGTGGAVDINSNKLRSVQTQAWQGTVTVPHAADSSVVIASMARESGNGCPGLILFRGTGGSIIVLANGGTLILYENSVNKNSTAVTIVNGTQYQFALYRDASSAAGYFNGTSSVAGALTSSAAATTVGPHIQSSLDAGTVTCDNFAVWPRNPTIPYWVDRITDTDDDDYLLYEEFVTPATYPLTSPRRCEYGPGSLTLVQTAGSFTVDMNGRLGLGTSSSVDGTGSHIVGSALTRAAGRALLISGVQPSGGDVAATTPYVGLWANTTPDTDLTTAREAMYGPYLGNLLFSTPTETYLALASQGTSAYDYATILRATGAFFAFRPTDSNDWKLGVVTVSGNAATLYPVVLSRSATVTPTIDSLIVPTLKWVPTPLASDSFNRANSSSLGNTDGAGVEETGGSGLAWVEYNEAGTLDCSIATNALSIPATAANYGGAVVDVGQTNALAQASMTLGGTGSASAGLVMRLNGDDVILAYVVDSGDLFNLYKSIGGSAATVATVAVTITAGATYALQGSADGTSFTAYLNAASRISSTITGATGTQFGCRAFNGTTTFDNFAVWPRRLTSFPWTLPTRAADVYQLYDRFDTDAAAPLATPRRPEPGPGGNATVIDTTANKLSISGGKLTFAAGITWGNGGFHCSAIPRAAGTLLFVDVNLSTNADGSFLLAMAKSATIDFTSFINQDGAIYAAGAASLSTGSGNATARTVGTLPTSTEKTYAIAMRASGYHAIDQTASTLLWVDSIGSTSPIYPAFSNNSCAGKLDNFRVTVAGTWSPTPLASDSFNGRATLGSTDGAGAEEAGGDGLAWTSHLGNWTVVSDKASCSTSSIASVDVGVSNVIVQATMTTGPASTGHPAVCFRLSDVSNFFMAYAHNDSNTFYIYERTAGSFASRASTAVTLADSTAYQITAIVDGTGLQAYLSGANRLAHTSSNKQANTLHGIYADNVTSGTVTADNFVVWPRTITNFPNV